MSRGISLPSLNWELNTHPQIPEILAVGRMLRRRGDGRNMWDIHRLSHLNRSLGDPGGKTVMVYGIPGQYPVLDVC